MFVTVAQVMLGIGEIAIRSKKHLQKRSEFIGLEHLYHKPLLKLEDIMNELMEYKKMVEPYVCDVSLILECTERGKNRFFLRECAGTLKDPDHGIYPMVTSSSTLALMVLSLQACLHMRSRRSATVCKAYSSAVGAGAFVSEIPGEEADELRKRGGDGGEFGATTGRPRRMGWFDCVASKYGCRLQELQTLLYSTGCSGISG